MALPFATRDLILGAMDLPTEDVECPEWGCVVKVRALTGAERDAFEGSMVAEKGQTRAEKFANIRSRFCAMTIVGEDGHTPLFSHADVEALGRKNARALNKVFDVARKLSGFTDGDIKELEGN